MNSDAVISIGPDFNIFRKLGRSDEFFPAIGDGGVRVLLATEPISQYSFLNDTEFLSRFDLVAAHFSKTIPISYTVHPDKIFKKLGAGFDSRGNLIAAFVSNCADETNGRMALLTKLHSRLGIDSFGGCLHTKDLPLTSSPTDTIDARRSQKLTILSTFKFAVAFESCNDDYYLTEKIFDALIAGAVPVFFGTRFLSDIFPMKNAVIDSSRFDSVDDLAAHIKNVSENRTAWESYQYWRTDEKEAAGRAAYVAGYEKSSRDSWDRQVCDAVRRRLDSPPTREL